MIKDWNIEEITGYKPITTFYTDFSIADRFGTAAIKDTYKNGLEYAKTDYKVLTELVMVLNWKIWEWYETDEKIAKVDGNCFKMTKDVQNIKNSQDLNKIGLELSEGKNVKWLPADFKKNGGYENINMQFLEVVNEEIRPVNF